MADYFVNSRIPKEIKLKREEKLLEVCFDDGALYSFPAEFLRVHSPSAEVQGHSEDQRIVLAGRRHVGILSVEPVGQYAIRIDFDDMHDTGIYSWELLYEFGLRQEEMWGDYISELQSLGLSRDP